MATAKKTSSAPESEIPAAEPPAAQPPAKPDHTARNAIVIIAVVLCGAAMKWLTDILAPLALAIFLAVMIDGFARVMRERVKWISEDTAQPIAITVAILLFGAAVFVIGDNAAGFATQVQDYTPRLNALIHRLYALLGQDAPASVEELVRNANPGQYLVTIANGARAFLGPAFFVLIYLAFIIASRRGFRRKLVAMFPHHAERDDAMGTFQAIRVGVEQYLWVQTVTGLMIAAASWVVMMLVGLDNALFWTFLIFLTSYIPIIGGMAGTLLPAAFALLQFTTWWQAAVVFGGLQAVQFIVGTFILPKMQGDSLNMDPVVVLLSLAFWGAIWGMPGMFLSTPLTVMVMVILAQFPGSRWVAILLSANGNPHTPPRHTEVSNP